MNLLTGRLKRGHHGLLAHVYDSVRKGQPSLVEGEAGAAVVAVLEALWQKLPEERSSAVAEPGR